MHAGFDLASGSILRQVHGAMKSCNSNEGFTLIEVLAVIALISLLAGLGVSVSLGMSKRSQVAKAKADLQALSVALEAYRTDMGDYPRTEGVDADVLYRALDGRLHPLGHELNPVHKPWLQQGALEQDASSAQWVDPWGRPYQYSYTRGHVGSMVASYTLYSLGPDGLKGEAGSVENEDNLYADD